MFYFSYKPKTSLLKGNDKKAMVWQVCNGRFTITEKLWLNVHFFLSMFPSQRNENAIKI